MVELFAAFKQYLIWGLVLWVLFFGLFAALLANGQVNQLLAGIVRVLMAIVISPFIFLRKAAGSVLSFTRSEEDSYRRSDQYLLNKAMLVFQAILIVVAIGALAAITVLTWNTLVPPGLVRRDAKAYAADVENQRKTASAAAARAAKLDSEWAAKRDTVVAEFRRRQEVQINSAAGAMTAREKELTESNIQYVPEALARMKAIVASGDTDSPSNIEYTQRRADSVADNYGYWIGDWAKQTLNQWSAAWYGKALAQFVLNNTSEEELRRVEQPDHEEATAASERESEKLGAMEAILTSKREAASLKWKSAAWSAVASFVTFLLYVWLGGALIEGGWLAIRIADDVRRIREQAVAAEPEAVTFGPRMSIRTEAKLSAPSQPAEA